MEADCCDHVRKCHKCQIYADNIHGIDMIGPIEPKAYNKHRFILVAINYFTTWVEVASYTNVTRNVMVKFIKKDLVCQYGIPSHIIIDNGTNLNNKMMTKLCEQFKIQYYNSIPYHPKNEQGCRSGK
ncbi:Pol polyprotein, partial [Mucuna pruriens]